MPQRLQLRTNSTRVSRSSLVAVFFAFAAIVGFGCSDPNALTELFGLARSVLPTTMTPLAGPTAGGTKVTVRGEGFTADTVVFVDGATPATFTVVNNGLIEFVTAPHAAGEVNVVLQRPGTDAVNVDSPFTYLSPADSEPAVSISGMLKRTSLSATDRCGLICLA